MSIAPGRKAKTATVMMMLGWGSGPTGAQKGRSETVPVARQAVGPPTSRQVARTPHKDRHSLSEVSCSMLSNFHQVACEHTASPNYRQARKPAGLQSMDMLHPRSSGNPSIRPTEHEIDLGTLFQLIGVIVTLPAALYGIYQLALLYLEHRSPRIITVRNSVGSTFASFCRVLRVSRAHCTDTLTATKNLVHQGLQRFRHRQYNFPPTDISQIYQTSSNSIDSNWQSLMILRVRHLWTHTLDKLRKRTRLSGGDISGDVEGFPEP